MTHPPRMRVSDEVWILPGVFAAVLFDIFIFGVLSDSPMAFERALVVATGSALLAVAANQIFQDSSPIAGILDRLAVVFAGLLTIAFVMLAIPLIVVGVISYTAMATGWRVVGRRVWNKIRASH